MTITLLKKYSLEKYSKISLQFCTPQKPFTYLLIEVHLSFHKTVVIKQNICFRKTSTFLSLLKTDVSLFIRLKNQLGLIKICLTHLRSRIPLTNCLFFYFFSYHGAQVLISTDFCAQNVFWQTSDHLPNFVINVDREVLFLSCVN